MPVIAAILFMVAYNMCGWREFVKICRAAPKSDVLVLVLTFLLTVIFDLVVAIEVGLILAAVLFMVRMASVTHVRHWEKHEEELRSVPAHTDVIEIDGPIFFAASDRLSGIELEEGTKYLVLRMGKVPAVDMTAITVLEKLVESCEKRRVRLFVTRVEEQPLRVLKKAKLLDRIGQENLFDGIDSALQYIENESAKEEVLIHE